MAILVKESFNDIDFCLDPNLVLYVPLYHTDGVSFMSKDAYGRLCTVTGALWTPQGRYFDGIDDYIHLKDADFISKSAALSIGIWFKPSSVTGDQHLYAESIPSPVFLVRISGTVVEFGIYRAGIWYFATGTTVLQIGTNYYIVATLGSGGMTVYLNGAIEVTNANTLPTDQTIISSDIGAYIDAGLLPAGEFTGLIGEVRIYNRALTPLEIQQNYLVTKWRYKG